MCALNASFARPGNAVQSMLTVFTIDLTGCWVQAYLCGYLGAGGTYGFKGMSCTK